MATNKLFGVDFAKVLGAAFSGQLVTMMLHRQPDLTLDRVGGTVTPGATVSYSFEGIVESRGNVRGLAGLAKQRSRSILLMTDSVRDSSGEKVVGFVPEVGDTVADDEGLEQKVVEIPSRDPAGATYNLDLA
ncbi:MAG: hypothetical protein DRJ65_19535 [Acidobacteria bacterium]|nr:MAG: hypothetical protein DRJ65_19535 [Acidobacteriota bacterium]